MNDTPKYIQRKQFELIMAKPLKDRINELFEMTELSRNIIRNRIKEKKPEISEIELKIELFKTFYRFDFEEEKLNLIAENMRKFWIINQQLSEKVQLE